MTLLTLFAAGIAILTLAAAVMVVTAKAPIHAACFLILTLLGVASAYAVLEAHTLALLQVLIYAGAIVVLMVFVLMLMGSGPEDEEPVTLGSWRVIVGGVMAFSLFVLFGLAMSQVGLQAGGETAVGYGSLHSLGELLLGEYVVSFEVISLLIMVAIVGSVALLRRNVGAKDGEEAGE